MMKAGRCGGRGRKSEVEGGGGKGSDKGTIGGEERGGKGKGEVTEDDRRAGEGGMAAVM